MEHTSASALPTMYLPASRASDQDLQRQIGLFRTVPLGAQFMDASLELSAALNRHRQVIHYNAAFAEFLSARGARLELGLRPGEAVQCVHAAESPGGCGTTEACRSCGAAHGIAAGLKGRSHTEECHIQTQTAADDLTLLVRATPITIESEPMVILALRDVADEKRRRWLERMFFHDVVNTAGSIQGLAELIRSRPSEETARKYGPLLASVANSLLGELEAQRDLVAAERNEVEVRPTVFPLRSLLDEVAIAAMGHRVGAGRFVFVAPESEDVLARTDRRLLTRVLANLVKNGLEAESKGGIVTLRAWQTGPNMVIEVHNPTPMPRDVALQVFQRSFSTKGPDRGLGTYSVRLFSERYLGGHVRLVSTPTTGTVFRAEYPVWLSEADAP